MTAAATPPVSMRWLIASAGVLVALGLVSTRIGFAPFQFRFGVLVLLAGGVVATLGLSTWRRAPSSRIGPLLLLCSAAWFVPGLRWVAWPPLADAAAAVSLVWAAILAHATLTWPEGRSDRTPIVLVVILLQFYKLKKGWEQKLDKAGPVAEPR